MRRYGIPHIRVLWSGSQQKHPDIWVQLGNPPVITVTAEWKKQSASEREKRLLHELQHIIGKQHGVIEGRLFSTYPESDAYTRFLYTGMKNNPPEYLESHPEYRDWRHPRWKKERMTAAERKEQYQRVLAATGNASLARRAGDWTSNHVEQLLRSLSADSAGGTAYTRTNPGEQTGVRDVRCMICRVHFSAKESAVHTRLTGHNRWALPGYLGMKRRR
jgi:hypothetical protein